MAWTRLIRFLCCFAPLYGISTTFVLYLAILQGQEQFADHYYSGFYDGLLNMSTAASMENEALWVSSIGVRNSKSSNPRTNPAVSSATTSPQPTPTLSDFEALVNKTTLDIPLQAYQKETSPVQDLLKVYVYDTLPPHLSTDLEDFVENIGQKYNWITDLILIKLFQSFPGRTYNPKEADIFVVPYLHIAHCMKAGYQHECRSLKENPTSQEILRNLPHYNASTKDRHLFFLSESEFMSHRWLLKLPLIAMYGPRWEHQGKRSKTLSRPGHILIPQFNSRVDFQPSVVLQQQQQSTQHRDLSLVFVAPYLNKNMGGGGVKSPRIFRKFLLERLQSMPAQKIGGLPFIASDNITDSIDIHSNQKDGLYGLYRRSIFCPILAGDITWQRRFFDVMACGCLPVVMSYKLAAPYEQSRNEKDDNPRDSEWASQYSWFVPEHAYEIGDTWSVRESYPYVDQIDYRSFTVEVEGNLTVHNDTSHFVPTLEAIMTESQTANDLNTALERKRQAMSETAISFLYGVGPDAHRHDDAFAHLIRSLRCYLDKHMDSSAMG